MTTLYAQPPPTPSPGLLGNLKGRFWSSLESPEGYARGLGMVTPLVSRTWLWSEQRILQRLPAFERLVMWKWDEWRKLSTTEDARLHFLRGFRNLVGPRLNQIRNDDGRRRLNRLLCKVEARLGIPDPYCRPTRARLELTDACNLRCPMCPQDFWDWKRTYAEEWLLDRAASLYPWLTAIDLTSLGETMLSPFFTKALERLEPHLHSEMITNGLMVNPEMARLLVKHLSELHVSIDAATAETYRKMREVESFPKVVENCRNLVQAKRETGRDLPTLVFNFTMTRKNIEELPDVIRLAAKIGFQRVHANYLFVWVPQLREDSVFWMRERACEILDDADRVANEEGVQFFHPQKPLEEHERTSDFQRFCLEAWEFIHLRAEDKITVCCMGAEEYHAPQGADWEKIWDGPAYRAFRQRVNLPDEEAPPLCRSCLFGRDVQPGHPRYHFYEAAVEEHITGRVKDPFSVEETAS